MAKKRKGGRKPAHPAKAAAEPTEELQEAEESSAPRVPGEFPEPVAFTGVIKYAWRFYKPRLVPLAILFALAFIVLPLLPLATIQFADLSDRALYGVLLPLAFVPPVVAASILFAIASAQMAEEFAGRPAGLRDALRVMRGRTTHVFLAGALAAVFTMFLALLLGPALALTQPLFIVNVMVLPLVIVGPPIVLQAVVLEDKPLRVAWGRVRGLLAGHWARILIYLLALSAITGALFQLAVYGGLALLRGATDLQTIASLLIGEGIFIGLAVPFVAAAHLVMYLELRARSEDLTREGFVTERNPVPTSA